VEKIVIELKEHNGVIEKILSEQTEKINEIARLIINCYKNGGKVILFGNGGSAADAQHIAAELVGQYQLQRKGLPAIALTTNTSILTSIGNDYGFDKIFERQIESLVTNEDIVIGISTSGNSENVLKGILKAKEKGAQTIAFTGKNGGKLKDKVNILLNIPSNNTPRIQEAHITIGHIICGIVENEIFKKK
jgi:D-sedoheptulose 7-phosphate isomerase